MLEKIKDHPILSIIGAVAAVVGIVIGVLSLVEAEYATVTDGEKCGYTDKVETTKPYKWKECSNPNKVTGYKHSETVSKSSGRVGGGYD